MKPDSFNRIAAIYYPLKKLFFGNKLEFFIEELCKKQLSKNSVLVIGEGRGESLPYLLHLGENYTVIDASEKMISKNGDLKLDEGKKLNAVIQDVFIFHPEIKYEYIVLPYFLSCVRDNEIEDLLNKMESWLAPEGRVIITDFFNSSTFGRYILMKLMYLFFNLTCQLGRWEYPVPEKLNNWQKFEVEKKVRKGSLAGYILKRKSSSK